MRKAKNKRDRNGKNKVARTIHVQRQQDTELAKKRYVRLEVSLQFKKLIVVCFSPIAHTNPCSSENAKNYLVFTFYS